MLVPRHFADVVDVAIEQRIDCALSASKSKQIVSFYISIIDIIMRTLISILMTKKSASKTFTKNQFPATRGGISLRVQ